MYPCIPCKVTQAPPKQALGLGKGQQCKIHTSVHVHFHQLQNAYNVPSSSSWERYSLASLSLFWGAVSSSSSDSMWSWNPLFPWAFPSITLWRHMAQYIYTCVTSTVHQVHYRLNVLFIWITSYLFIKPIYFPSGLLLNSSLAFLHYGHSNNIKYAIHHCLSRKLAPKQIKRWLLMERFPKLTKICSHFVNHC